MENSHDYEPRVGSRMLTIETIFTGNASNDVLTDLYMDPQDVRRTPPPKLPDRNKPMSEKPPTVPPKSANVVNIVQQKNEKKSKIDQNSKENANNFLQPCLNVNQRRVVKYNLLLSMTINVLVMALGGTGFVSIVSGKHEEETSYKYGKESFKSE